MKALVAVVVLCFLARQVAGGRPLGLASGSIPDSSITASSTTSYYCRTSRARLHHSELYRLPKGGAWCAARKNAHQWIQVDLLAFFNISGVATQGRSNYPQWVTSFKLDCSLDGLNFDTIRDMPGSLIDKVFTGNTDGNTVVYNPLPVPKVCRFVRVLPLTWNGWISLRMEIYGEGPITGGLPLGA